MFDDRIRWWEKGLDDQPDWDSGADRPAVSLIVSGFFYGVFGVLLGAEWVSRKIRGIK